MTTRTETAPMVAAPAHYARRLTLGAIAALGLNLLAYALGTLAGASWAVSTGQVIGILMVVGATLLPMFLAGTVLWLLVRRWPRLQGRAAWAGLAFGVLTMPMSLISANDFTTGIFLASMHAFTGVAWLIAVKPVSTRN